MKKTKIKIAEGGIAIVLVIILIALVCGVSWIATCGIIKLITLCFGWQFKWNIATGIWLVIFLLQSIFQKNINVKN